MTNKETAIGVATIRYDEQGQVTFAEFAPTLAIESETVLPQLRQLSGSADITTVEENAGLLLGAWFERLNVIELADREQYKIATETVSCDRYPNGNIRECQLRFVFKRVIVSTLH